MSKALLGAWLLLCLFISNEGGTQKMQTNPPIRVLIVTGGHDRYADENPSYRRLVWQAIRWVAGR